MTPEPTADKPIDRTEQPTSLVYISRLSGNGIVAGLGFTKVFAFSVPEALRRLATELEKEERLKGPKADLSFEELYLSVRTYNCVKDAGIKTIGELAEFGPIRLLRIKNFGIKSLREVMLVLKDAGVPLREPNEEELKSALWRRYWEKAKEGLRDDQQH